MCGAKHKSVQCTKDLGVKIASELKFSQQYTKTANKANIIFCFINRNFSVESADVTLPICNGVVRPHLEYAG